MLWDNNLSMTEKAKREEYLKTKISEGFSLFYDKKKNFIEKKEVPYVMRYLGQFPSEAQVRDAILPEVLTISLRSKRTNHLNPSNTPNFSLTCLEVITMSFSSKRTVVLTRRPRDCISCFSAARPRGQRLHRNRGNEETSGNLRYRIRAEGDSGLRGIRNKQGCRGQSHLL